MKALPASKFLVLLGTATALGACALDPNDPGDTPSDEETSSVDGIGPYSARYGVDYSYARPSPATLHADGYTFAARYESPQAGKNLTATEANALIAAGLDVVSVWEDGADNALGGFNRGVSDAHAANSQFVADGMPSTRPIYFAIDFDATSGQQAAINAYFDGVASVIGRGRTGAYGGYYPVARLFNAGKIQWAWQTYAWSGGLWDSRAQLRQIQNGILGNCCDKDQAMVGDFGQWGHQAPTLTQGSGAGTVIDKNGSYHVFGINSSGVLEQAVYASGTWQWQALGGTVRGHPGVAYNPATHRFDVFAPGTNGVMYQKTYTSSGWGDWHSIGGSNLTAGASAILDKYGTYHVFTVNTAGTTYHAYYTGGVWHWQSLGGTILGPPGSAYDPSSHRFDVFAPGANGVMYQRTYSNGDWDAWHSIGGSNFATGASALIGGGGVYHVFAVNRSNVLYQAYYVSGGWHWQALGGAVRGVPGVVFTPATNRYDVFAPGTNGVMYQKMYSGSWTAWHAIGGSSFDEVDDGPIDFDDVMTGAVEDSVEVPE